MPSPLNLSPEIQQRLRCPHCKATVSVSVDEVICGDLGCGRRYPLVNGIPILINEDESLFRVAEIQNDLRKLPAPPTWKDRLRPFIPPLSRNYRAEANYRRIRQMLEGNPAPRILNLGAGFVGAGVQELMATPGLEMVNTDIYRSPSTSIICDAHDIPFADASFDAVILQAVLYLLQEPPKAVSEVHRVLKPNGIVYAETPFLQQVIGGRYDFVRYTSLGHRRLFRHFSEDASGGVGGPGMVMAWSYAYLLIAFPRSRALRSVLFTFAQLTAFWLPMLDRWFASLPCAIDCASGVYFLGRRSDQVVPDREIIQTYRGCVGI